MAPEFVVLALVLLAALLHAIWNALVAASDDAWLTSFFLVGTGSLVCLAAVPFVEAPDRASWPYLAAGVVLHNIYFGFLVLSYRAGDLSHVYPLARGTGPLWVAILSGPVAGEVLQSTDWIGVLLVCGGVGSLAFAGGGGGQRNVAAVAWALGTGVWIASYTLVDGMGVRRSDNTLGFIVWLQALEALPFAAFTLLLRPRAEVLGFARRGGLRGAVGGILAIVAYACVLWAYSLGALAPIAALRETSVVIAALIGTGILGEPMGRRRVLAAACVAAGAVALQLSSLA